MSVHRQVFIFDRVTKGWDPQSALVVAWAIHPFESNLQPSRRTEKTVRKLSKAFARRCRNASEKVSVSDACETLRSYSEIAEQDENSPYPDMWMGIIQASSAED